MNLKRHKTHAHRTFNNTFAWFTLITLLWTNNLSARPVLASVSWCCSLRCRRPISRLCTKSHINNCLRLIFDATHNNKSQWSIVKQSIVDYCWANSIWNGIAIGAIGYTQWEIRIALIECTLENNKHCTNVEPTTVYSIYQ